MEYNFDPTKEYTPLPDEYLQNGGRWENDNYKPRRKIKKMFYLFITFAVMSLAVYTSEVTVRNKILAENQDDSGSLSDKAGDIAGDITGDTGNTDNINNADKGTEETQLPAYPLENGVLKYIVYNETIEYHPEREVRVAEVVLDEGEIQIEQFTSGYEYRIPAYNAADNFIFLGWVAKYDNGTNAYPRYHLLGDTISSNDVSQIKPDSDGVRTIEIHAAWRVDVPTTPTYKMVLDANGGTIDKEASKEYDTLTPKASSGIVYLSAYPIPVREGYKFTGWYKSADLQGKPQEYMYGANFYEVKNNEPDWSALRTVTLYAGWEKISR